jgi:hypothetical protein
MDIDEQQQKQLEETKVPLDVLLRLHKRNDLPQAEDSENFQHPK